MGSSKPVADKKTRKKLREAMQELKEGNKTPFGKYDMDEHTQSKGK